MSDKLKILLLEDPARSRKEIENALFLMGTSRLEIHIVYDIKNFRSALTTFLPGIVIASCAATDCNGHQALNLLLNTIPEVPFLCISTAEFEEEAIRLIDNGAADYLLRDRLKRLPVLISALADQRQTVFHERRQINELLSRIPASVCVLRGPDCIFEFANPLYLKIAGTHDVIGKPLRSVLPAAQEERVLKIMNQVYHDGKTYFDHEVQVPVFIEDKSETNYFNFVVQALRDASGRVDGILVYGIDVTAQVSSRKEAERLQQEIEHLFEAVNEGFFLKDIIKNRYTHFSVACAKIFGYSVEDFFEQPNLWYESVHPDDRHAADEHWRSMLQGKSAHLKFRIIRKDKTIRWVEAKTIPHLTDGVLTTIEGVVNDITQSMLAEQKIIQAEALLSEAQHLAKIGNWNYDLIKDELTWSDGLKKIYWGDHNLIPRNEYYDRLIHPDDRKRMGAEVEELKRLGENMEASFRIINTEGEIKILKGENRIELDKDGKPIRLYGVLQDVTAIKMAEETLKKSEASLRTLLNHADTAYILVDADLCIVSYSLKAKEISIMQGYGVPVEGSSILDYFDEVKHLKLRKIIQEVMNGADTHYEMNREGKDGVMKWYAFKWIAVNDEDHRNWGFILSVKDITQQKNAAKERNRMTNELLNRNKDLEQFTYVVSHNLRAPLANIIGISDLLTHTDTDEGTSKTLMEGLTRSVRSLDTVIKDLNEILQVKKEKTGKKLELVNIKQVLEEIRLSINHLIVKEQVEFECLLQQTEFHTVRSYIYSIFYNLILNSIKYRLPDQSPYVMIQSYVTEQRICFIFKDNGKGIDLERFGPELFGLYKRFDQDIDGKGLGLFMVKTQVEELGGTIDAKSEPGQGTTFSINLPYIAH